MPSIDVPGTGPGASFLDDEVTIVPTYMLGDMMTVDADHLLQENTQNQPVRSVVSSSEHRTHS